MMSGGRMLHDLLRHAAAAHPSRVALIDGDRRLTYAQLHDRASRMARLLAHAGVRQGDRVGLYLPKSAEAITAIYATLMAGAAYVPLDPQAPPARLAGIVADCGTRCLISSVHLATARNALLAIGVPVEAVVVADDPGPVSPRARGCGKPPNPQVRWFGGRDINTAGQHGLPPPSADPESLAYILYTSGSTGAPKGVMLNHGNALAFVRWAADTCALTPADRVSSHAPLHFDLSIFDVFATAMAAATLVLVPPRLTIFAADVAALIERAGITVWYSVPSALTMLLDGGGLPRRDLTRLRLVAFAGEVFPLLRLRQLIALLPQVRFLNFYGPTETNVCTWHEVGALPPAATAIPIGRAITGVSLFVITGDGRLADPGEAGELHVSGPTVMRGYWNAPERSARVLVRPPAPGDGPAYRTGDLVYHDGTGVHYFIGRADQQLKIRGYRIEPGDVEAALVTHPEVTDSAAFAVSDAIGTARLVAVVTARDTDADELARHCAARLPPQMVPDLIEVRTALPRTSTGKIDRAALRAGTSFPSRRGHACRKEPLMPADHPADTALQNATFWEDYWQARESDGKPPVWGVPVDPARLPGLMNASLPIIDLGCGDGTQTALLARHFQNVVAVDVSPAAIDRAKRMNPHPHVTYLVLDLFDQQAVRALHERLGDANVYMKAVLHRIAPDTRPAFIAGLRTLLGDRGTLQLLELGPGAAERLEEIIGGPMRPNSWHRLVTGDEVMTLLGAGYEIIDTGDDHMPTTHKLPDGRPARLPAIHLTARRVQRQT